MSGSAASRQTDDPLERAPRARGTLRPTPHRGSAVPLAFLVRETVLQAQLDAVRRQLDVVHRGIAARIPVGPAPAPPRPPKRGAAAEGPPTVRVPAPVAPSVRLRRTATPEQIVRAHPIVTDAPSVRSDRALLHVQTVLIGRIGQSARMVNSAMSGLTGQMRPSVPAGRTPEVLPVAQNGLTAVVLLPSVTGAPMGKRGLSAARTGAQGFGRQAVQTPTRPLEMCEATGRDPAARDPRVRAMRVVLLVLAGMRHQHVEQPRVAASRVRCGLRGFAVHRRFVRSGRRCRELSSLSSRRG